MKSRTRVRTVVVALAALFLFAEVAYGEVGPAVWLPGESWRGGKQFDARLERGVRFWGTGAPLGRVFAEISRQTGVEFGFDPPGDDTARICINLYLNPARPPTLREVMVQLAWVTGCSFACTGERERRKYVLLGTSIGVDALERAEAEELHAAREADRQQEQERAELHRKAVAMLPELQQALRLSQAEAIARYRGKNDRLLHALLDPNERPAAELVASLPSAELAALPPEKQLTRKWEELTPELRDPVRRLLHRTLVAADREPPPDRPRPDLHVDDLTWPDQFSPSVRVGDRDDGFRVQAFFSLPEAEGGFGTYAATTSFGLISNADLSPDPRTISTLKRLLGERVEEEAERREIGARAAEMERAAAQEQVRARVAAQRALSPQAAAALAAVPLPIHLRSAYALWQLEEATAARSGRNVISDCFWQPPRSLAPVADLLGLSEPNALTALTAGCVGRYDRKVLLADIGGTKSAEALNWEWGDAGEFLRFRSAERALWRAAFLPEGVVRTLNAWIEPHLTGRPEWIDVPLDVREYVQLKAQLTQPQERWGGRLTYGDPTDAKEAQRQALREFMGQPLVWGGSTTCALLAGLTDEQWRRLESDGLVWAVDVGAERMPLRMMIPGYVLMRGDVLRLGAVETHDVAGETLQARPVRVIPAQGAAPEESLWLPVQARVWGTRGEHLSRVLP